MNVLHEANPELREANPELRETNPELRETNRYFTNYQLKRVKLRKDDSIKPNFIVHL